MYRPLLEVVAVVALAAHALSAGIIRDLEDLEETYDYVIGGGGLSGLVVAARLTEDPDVSVLVVEYGDFDDSLNVDLPFYSKTMKVEDIFFHNSVPQVGLANRTASLAVGAVVGGGSTVNGMAWDRGSKPDYDAWEELGNPGWGWDGMLTYFQKSSTLTLPSEELVEEYEYALSGDGFGDGPVQVSLPSWQWPSTYTYIDAFDAAGIKLRFDGGTDGSNVGFHWNPSDIDPVNGTRSSSRRAYYDPASDRPNLSIIVNTFVATVNFDDTTATGINIISRDTGDAVSINATKEVVLATGAAHTPQILQLSGVGPRDLLESFDIDVVADLPGVGANFQDHLSISTAWRFTNDVELNPSLTNDEEFLEEAFEEYWANKTGPITHTGKSCRVMLTLHNITSEADDIIAALEEEDPAAYLSDIYTQSEELLAGYTAQHAIMTAMLSREDVSVFEHTFGGDASISFHPEKPFSRGTIRIQSTDPHPSDSPVSIDFGALTHPLDLKISLFGLKFGRSVMAGEAMAALGMIEMVPGANITDDGELEELMRSQYVRPSNAHPVGTTAMMPRELGGVVDPRLRVYGVERLRVVDAGVMPLLPTCHTQATTYAIAEKAADLIKEDALDG